MINLLIVYFGKFPNYFQLYLDSVSINQDILHIFLITDINTNQYKLPNNVTVIESTLPEIRLKLKILLSESFSLEKIEPNKLIPYNYKLCDIRPFYPILFKDHLSHLTSKDYVGSGDCDLIYGKLSNYIKNNSYDIIGRQGHLTAIKYQSDLIDLYKQIDYNKIIDSEYQHLDERDYYDIIIKTITEKKYSRFPSENYICDIIPECFYSARTLCGRVLNQSYSKELIDTYSLYQEVDRLIENIVFDSTKETLVVNYNDKTQREVLYCHLQKRPLNIHFDTYEQNFIIHRDGFYTKEIK